MPKTVFMYPGQGSQYRGMAKEAADTVDEAGALFEDATRYASEKMGRDIGYIMLQGSDEELSDTRIAQPTIFIANIVGSSALRHIVGQDADKRVGHSFGHIAALHDDGVIDTHTGIDIAIHRGEAMHQASLDTPGAMAAFIRITEDKLLEICKKWNLHWANDNSNTEQIVSGTEEDLEGARADVEESGGRFIKIPVKAGAHSPLVQSAADRMSILAENLHRKQRKMHLPEGLKVYSSRTLQNLKSMADIKGDIAGLTDRVKWRQTVEHLVAEGYTEFYETGPGAKLSKLPQRDAKTKELLEANGVTMVSLDELLSRRVA